MMKFYRYIDQPNYGDWDGVKIREDILYLIKETPCGYWVSYDPYYDSKDIHFRGNRKRWISKTSKKRFAYPTREEAKISFKARKAMQIKILLYQLENAKNAAAYADMQIDKYIERAEGNHD